VIFPDPAVTEPVTPAIPPGSARPGWVRWQICALLFFATTINYMDRQVLGILAPVLQREIGWNEIEYSNIVVAFQTAYAAGLLLAGAFMDRFGTRLGYALAMFFWSLAACGHALAGSAAGFATARFALGIGEAGNFPAAIKTVAEWFPKRERAFATGIFNSGSNIGAVLAPLAVPWIALHWGWPWAFIGVGAAGFVWLLFWLAKYRAPDAHPYLSASELALIRSDPEERSEKIPWVELLRYRQTWAFAIGKFLTDPVWWFYLYWLAKFLDKNHGIKLSQISLPLVVIYLGADFGSIGGGWLSSGLIRRGWSANAARKGALLLCAVAVVPVIFAAWAHDLWTAVALVTLAAAAHQGWSANLFTLAPDLFPRRAVGSVVGLGGMAGAVGGMLFSGVTGRLLERNGGNYVPVFLACGSAYLLAFVFIQLLTPKLEPAGL
jgi:ACS family hexuronate transporter-like MFS transporter